MADRIACDAAGKVFGTISCGHCLQPIEDPVKLPCDHVFCAQCVQDDYKILQKVKCRICDKTYPGMTLRSISGLRLEMVDDSMINSEASPIPCKSNSCKEQSIIYCKHPKCEKLMCRLHLEIHNKNFEGDGHDEHFVSMDLYAKGKQKYIAVRCNTHPENSIVNVCECCYLTFCLNCDISTPCMTTNDSSWDPAKLLRKVWKKVFRTNHQLCPPWTLRKKVTSHYENELLKPINDKVATLRCLEKKSWQQWTQTKERAASLIIQLEADAEAQIAEIRKKLAAEKRKVEAHVELNTINVERYTSDMITKIEGLQALWHQTRSYLDTAADAELMREFRQKSRELQAMSVVEAREPPHLSAGSLSASRGTGGSKELMFSVTRRDIEFYSQHAIEGVNSLVLTNTGITVCAAINGDLSMVDVFGFKEVLNLETAIKWHSLSIDDNGNIIGLGNSQITNEACVKLFKPSEEYIEELFSHPNSSGRQRPSQIGILRDRDNADEVIITGLIVLDIGDCTLSCFSSEGDSRGSMELLSMTNPRGLCTIIGNYILITDCVTNGSVTKYRITKSGELDLIWKRTGLDNPISVCVDQKGNIYVASQGGSALIYLLSDYGDIIAELKSKKFEADDIISDIYVCGDFLAVALEQKIQLYKLITTC